MFSLRENKEVDVRTAEIVLFSDSLMISLIRCERTREDDDVSWVDVLRESAFVWFSTLPVSWSTPLVMETVEGTGV